MWGRYEHSLDDKGRFIVPQKFREKIGTDCVLTTGPDGHIRVYPTEVWEDLERLLLDQDAYDELNSDLALLQRMFGNSDFAAIDQNGRLTVQRYLREWAEISEGETAIIVGNNNRLEIWNKNRWKGVSSDFTASKTNETMLRRKSNLPPPAADPTAVTAEGGELKE
jgi:MraZ protein